MEIEMETENMDLNQKIRMQIIRLALEAFSFEVNSPSELFESSIFEAAMIFCNGNQVQAAKLLGVSRGTLRTKLKQYFNTTKVGGLYHESIFFKNEAIEPKEKLKFLEDRMATKYMHEYVKNLKALNLKNKTNNREQV